MPTINDTFQLYLLIRRTCKTQTMECKDQVLMFAFIAVAVSIAVTSAADENVCEREKFTGPCRAGFPRWYWDKDECECKQFTYGGCRSNGNNFETKEACKNECGDQPCTPESKESGVCMKPKHSGPCYADFRNWYWNKDTCKCEQFTYGGCDNNGNNFQTETACMEKCGETPCKE